MTPATRAISPTTPMVIGFSDGGFGVGMGVEVGGARVGTRVSVAGGLGVKVGARVWVASGVVVSLTPGVVFPAAC